MDCSVSYVTGLQHEPADLPFGLTDRFKPTINLLGGGVAFVRFTGVVGCFCE